MNRNTIGVAVIAVLAVMGLGLTAATITDTYSNSIDVGPGNGGISPGGDPGDVQGEVRETDNDDGEGGGQGSPLELPDICVELLTQTPVILGIVLGFLGLVGLTYRQRGFIAAGFIGYLIGLPMIVGYGLATQCGDGAVTGGEGGNPVLENVGEFVGGASATTVPPTLLIGVFLVAAVIAIGVVASASRSEEVSVPEPEEEDEPGLEEFAAVAGEAADRIESTDASVDNAVYRAWLEMTNLLNLDDPDTSTAGEFADAAIEAGVDEDDVGDLTQLFEEVRYGDMDPEPREEMALETLRRMEENYGTTDDVAEDEGNGVDGT